ncbi:MAG: arginine--tRNA ligase [Candidatus Paceibacterota bacterium]|jgi:arginyl-tRNA synthetase
MIAGKIKTLIQKAGDSLGFELPIVHLEHPDILSHGDYATSVALAAAKSAGKAPKEIADLLKAEIEKSLPEEIEKVEVAGPGFLNFHLSRKFLADSIGEIVSNKDFGKGDALSGKKALFEYTDPNPFKAFHIGHLMANAVGETLSRIAENQGADVKRLCYQGDIGLHVAKAVWAMKQMKEKMPKDEDSFDAKVAFMGEAYVLGTNTYEDDPKVAEEIKEINKKLFDRSDSKLQELYDKGREWSLEYFDSIYKKLDTHFDGFIFESEVGPVGKEIVEKNIPNVFTESEGAVIFKGEDHGLHTRVFLNSQRLPTYEAKELGNTVEKEKRYDFDISIVTSASEITDYFKVVKCAYALINPEAASKIGFIGHGMLRFAEGKMSSRKGNIITGEGLLNDIAAIVAEKIKDRELSDKEKEEICNGVAVAAIKYSILRQSPGKDIIFDREKSLSFEGDSGPYLQYATVRAHSLIEKAKASSVEANTTSVPADVATIEKLLYRFPEVALRSWEEKAPQLLVEYLTSLAGAFNNFYAQGLIVSDASDSPYKVAITKAFGTVMERGLGLLGIPVLKKM